MKKIEEYLDNENNIEIKSYNYEKSKGFSQETAVDSVYSTNEKHKFIIEINNINYEVLFQDLEVVNKYAAMEEEWVEIENTKNSNTIQVSVFENNELLKYPNNILKLVNFNGDIQNFKELLIKAAKEIGIGCHYSSHLNSEDDYGRITPNVEDSKANVISDTALFINDYEKDFFEKFLKLKTYKEEQAFLYDVENEIVKIQKSEKEKQELLEQEQKKEAKEKIGKIVNPLFKELKELDNKKSDYISFINFKPKGEQYTIEELKKAINNLDKEDEVYYEMEKEALEFLIEYPPKEEEIKNKILKQISEVEYMDVLENYEYGNSEEYIYPAPEMQDPWDYPDYEHDENDYEPEEPFFQSEDEWLEYEYTKPRTLSVRFEAIKAYIENELSQDIVPNELQKAFNIKNELTDFLDNKINENKPIKQSNKNNLNKKRL